jgi:enterochelin esterase-like enzyme
MIVRSELILTFCLKIFKMKAIIGIYVLCMYSIATAQIPKISSGTIRHFENFRSKYVAARNIDVWLPDHYDHQKKYAVLYMHDGKSLFDSTIMWNHQEWGVDETMSALLATHKIKDCIVVGIYNGEALRHCEYFPQKPFESLAKYQQDTIFQYKRGNAYRIFAEPKIQSDNYLKFIVTELKPFIDSAFSTHKDQANTFIAGSSMGGLISMYAICEYPEVFGGAACLSTHWTGIFTAENNPIPAAFMQYLSTHLPAPKNHKIYFDYGSETLDVLYKPFQLQADQIMQQKGYRSNNWVTKEFVGADHSERSWSKRLDIPLQFLLNK